MVGVSLALQLADVMPATTSICLVEGFAFPQISPDGKPQYHPSFDARSTALSYSTRLIYEQMQVWDELQQWLCPIDSIHVSNRGRFGSTLLQAAEYSWPALGYVVENAWLGNALIQALYRQDRVELRSPAKVLGVTPKGEGVSLRLEGDGLEELDAGLLVVADGANSGLRDALGVVVEEKSYQQHALIANIATAQEHRGCAYERFTDEGPLALLPLLPGPAGENRSALVWTLPPDQAAELLDCSSAQFLQQLQQRFGYRLGRLLQVGERHSYPLALMQATEQVRQAVVVMGNAAHALHPVAGQGYNLALRDVAELAELIVSADDPGNELLLAEYYASRFNDMQRVHTITDTLVKLFSNNISVVGHARAMGLICVNLIAPIRTLMARQSMGMLGRMSKLQRRLSL